MHIPVTGELGAFRDARLYIEHRVLVLGMEIILVYLAQAEIYASVRLTVYSIHHPTTLHFTMLSDYPH